MKRRSHLRLIRSPRPCEHILRLAIRLRLPTLPWCHVVRAAFIEAARVDPTHDGAINRALAWQDWPCTA